MNILFLIIGLVLGIAVGTGASILIRKRILKGKREDILEKAELEGENIKKEKMLQAKERFLQLKSEHDKYVKRHKGEKKAHGQVS